MPSIESRFISWRRNNFDFELPVVKLVSVCIVDDDDDISPTPFPFGVEAAFGSIVLVLLIMLLLLLLFCELLRDDIGVITVDLPRPLPDRRLWPALIVLANRANWPRRPAADFNAGIARLDTCVLFICHASMAFWRRFSTFLACCLAISEISTLCAADSDGKIMMGDGARSIFINLNPLYICSAIFGHTNENCHCDCDGLVERMAC